VESRRGCSLGFTCVPASICCCCQARRLSVAVLYHYIDNLMIFFVVPWLGLAGMLLAVCLLDRTGLDVKDLDCRWTQRHVRCPNCHLFSSICCLVFTSSFCKSGINFTGIHARYSLHPPPHTCHDVLISTIQAKNFGGKKLTFSNPAHKISPDTRPRMVPVWGDR